MGKAVNVGNIVSVDAGGVIAVLVEDGIGDAGAAVCVALGNEFFAHPLVSKMEVNKIEISCLIFVL